MKKKIYIPKKNYSSILKKRQYKIDKYNCQTKLLDVQSQIQLLKNELKSLLDEEYILKEKIKDYTYYINIL